MAAASWTDGVRRGRCHRPSLLESLDPAFQIRATDEHAVAAGEAADADVRPESYDLPGRAAAGVRLAQRDDVVEVQRQWRSRHSERESTRVTRATAEFARLSRRLCDP